MVSLFSTVATFGLSCLAVLLVLRPLIEGDSKYENLGWDSRSCDEYNKTIEALLLLQHLLLAGEINRASYQAEKAELLSKAVESKAALLREAAR